MITINPKIMQIHGYNENHHWLLCKVADIMTRYKSCKFKNETLQKYTGWGRDKVTRVANELHSMNILQVKRTYKRYGGKGANEYQITTNFIGYLQSLEGQSFSVENDELAITENQTSQHVVVDNSKNTQSVEGSDNGKSDIAITENQTSNEIVNSQYSLIGEGKNFSKKNKSNFKTEIVTRSQSATPQIEIVNPYSFPDRKSFNAHIDNLKTRNARFRTEKVNQATLEKWGEEFRPQNEAETPEATQEDLARAMKKLPALSKFINKNQSYEDNQKHHDGRADQDSRERIGEEKASFRKGDESIFGGTICEQSPKMDGDNAGQVPNFEEGTRGLRSRGGEEVGNFTIGADTAESAGSVVITKQKGKNTHIENPAFKAGDFASLMKDSIQSYSGIP